MKAVLQNKLRLSLSEIRENIPLAEYTTFGIGGNADYFCVVQTKEDLNSILKWCKNCNIPFLMIGNGSNLLVTEEGFRGLVMKLEGDFKKINYTNETIKVGAGISLPILLQKAKTHSLGGLEPLVGIPGTVGGAVVMNAGTRYGRIGDVIDKLTVMDHQGLKILPKKSLKFFYRGSNIDPQKEIVIEAELSLDIKDEDEIDKDMKNYMRERKKRQPWNLKSAGCIFKNPSEGPAAKFIEEANLKGLSKGGAEVSKVHANFIVNTGKATSSDILYLIHAIQDKVYKKFGILLEPEIKIV
jgi:UDP-N-acetylmuramate dehydrogenase